MSQLIHDSFFGRSLRYLSHGKLLPYAEQNNPALLKRFTIDQSQSSPEKPFAERLSPDSSDGELMEKGDDPNIVGWYGPGDSEVSITCRLF